MKDANLTQISAQLESSFGGSGTGSIYRVRGSTGLDESQRRREGPQRVGFWRHFTGVASVAGEVELSLDAELSPSRALATLAGTMLSMTSETTIGSGLIRRRYSPSRSDVAALPSAKVLVAMSGGPWITFAGARLASLRLSVQAGALAKATLAVVAATRTRAESDPSWSEVVEDANMCRALDCSVLLDGVEMPSATGFSVEVQCQLEGRAASRSGAPQRVVRGGPLAVSGTISDRFGDTDLAGMAEDGAEHTLAVEFPGSLVPGRLVSLTMPRVVLTKADPALAGEGDAAVQCAFQAVENTGLTADQTVLEVVSAT